MYRKKRVITEQLIENFNDIAMRELGLDINEQNRLYDMDTNTIFQYKEKFLKYCDEEDRVVRGDEIELNLLENSRLMLTLFGIFVNKYTEQTGIYINTYYQSTAIRGELGYMGCKQEVANGISTEICSDTFLNESVRVFNLICKINGSEALYDFNNFDILSEVK